ncbi:MAG: cation:proton antiporter [Cyanobacteria bacterium P01_C01_bin.89]
MDSSFEISQLIVLTVGVGIGAQVLANYLKIPGIVCLLIFGIGLGRDGLDWLHPQLLGTGLDVIVSLSVALILFEGGLNLELRALNKVSGSLRNLVTLGTLIAFLGGGLAAHWLGEFPWAIAFLYSSLVVVTGPTVVGPLLKNVQVEKRVAALLEGEGVLIDPVGAILAVVVLDVVLNGGAEPLDVISGLAVRLGLGGLIGAIGGLLVAQFLKRATFVSDELNNLVVLASMWGTFALSQGAVSESGLMATVAMGIVLRASSVPDERTLRRFKGQLTILAVSVLFILLAADLSLASVATLGWGGPATVLVLMFLVRPLNVWLCTWNSDLRWQQKAFVSWVAPKGIVSASVASLFSILLTQNGLNGGDAIKALVFLTITMTVTLQGLTARPVAQWLGLRSREATGVLIVGSTPISRLVAGLFQKRGETVVLVDTDKEACAAAEQENLKVFLSSGLDMETLEKAGLESLGTFVAMTKNGEVNAVLAQRAAEEFAPPRVLAVFPREQAEAATVKIRQAFKADVMMKEWNQNLANQQIKFGTTTIRQETDSQADQIQHLRRLMGNDSLLPLLVERDRQLYIADVDHQWQQGDQIFYLWRDSRPQLMKKLSGDIQSELVPEKIAMVEDFPTDTPDAPETTNPLPTPSEA